MKTGPEVIKLFSCSIQLSTEFQMLIKTKIPTNKEASCFKVSQMFTLVNVNAPVVATTSWWLHFSAPVVELKVKKSIPVDFIIYL